jgi:hypothetical protein
VSREHRRAQLREMIIEHHRACMEHTEPIAVWVSKDEQKIEECPKPDLKAAGRALELLCRFDGLLEQPDNGGTLQLPLALQVATMLGINVSAQEREQPSHTALGAGDIIDAPQEDDA